MTDETEHRLQFWMKIAATCFALWSASIPIGIIMVDKQVDKITHAQEEFTKKFQNYVLEMDRRVTRLEERESQYRRKELSDGR